MNVVTMTGNVVKDLLPARVAAGKNVSTIRFASNSRKKELFIDLDVWEKDSEFAQKYLKKGSAIAVTGRLEMDQYPAKDGSGTKTNYKIVVTDIEFNEKKKDAVNTTAPVNQTTVATAVVAATPKKAMEPITSKNASGDPKSDFDDLF